MKNRVVPAAVAAGVAMLVLVACGSPAQPTAVSIDATVPSDESAPANPVASDQDPGDCSIAAVKYAELSDRLGDLFSGLADRISTQTGQLSAAADIADTATELNELDMSVCDDVAPTLVDAHNNRVLTAYHMGQGLLAMTQGDYSTATAEIETATDITSATAALSETGMEELSDAIQAYDD